MTVKELIEELKKYPAKYEVEFFITSVGTMGIKYVAEGELSNVVLYSNAGLRFSAQ